MKSAFKRALIASLLATTGLAAFAQGMGGPMGGPPPDGQHMGMRHADPAKMHERMAKHLDSFKAKLKITPDQEAAWSTFATAMKPPATPLERPNWKEIQKLSTPERIDKMRALRNQHQAEMDKRADAVKTFYAVLTPEQKKTFDVAHLRMQQGKHRGGMGPDHPKQ